MDPSHGEISRAMRNRGVEIYVPGEQEGVCWDLLDVKTLLHSAGVTGDCVCDLLVEIHKGIKTAIWGMWTIHPSILKTPKYNFEAIFNLLCIFGKGLHFTTLCCL